MKKFLKGDIVKLKSGGPWMTVASIKEKKMECLWFTDEKMLQSGKFEFEQLNKKPISIQES